MTTEQEVDEGNKQLLLNIQVEKSESYSVVIYSSYWIINKTTLPLQIKVYFKITLYGQKLVCKAHCIKKYNVLEHSSRNSICNFNGGTIIFYIS